MVWIDGPRLCRVLPGRAALTLPFLCLFLLSGRASAIDLSAPSQIVLSPGARTSFERGLAEAKKSPPNWNAAISHFTAAQQAQQDAITFPPLLLNLGLAHAKAGHEMAALYWLQAYLLAAPAASNAASIRELIARQRASVEDKITTIFDHARRVVQQFPQGASREWVVDYIDTAYARFLALTKRDITTAIQLAPAHESYLWQEHGRMLARLGDISGAIAVLDKIPARARIPIRPWSAASPAGPWTRSAPIGRRDDVRLAIADALERNGDAGPQLQTILAAFDDRDLSLKWQVQHTLRQKRPAEAMALVGHVASTDSRDQLLESIVDHYLYSDWKNPSRFSLARTAIGKISTPQGRGRATLALMISYLALDDPASARADAQAVQTSWPQAEVPLLVHIILDDRDVLSRVAYSLPRVRTFIRYHALKGEFHEARRVAETARRQLKGDELANLEETEAFELTWALRKRIPALLSQGRMQAAQDASAQFPRDDCDIDIRGFALMTWVGRVDMLRRIAEEQLARGSLDAAASTIQSMPVPVDDPGPFCWCVAEKAEQMSALARAYLSSGRVDEAKVVSSDIRSLIWRGALYGPVLRKLARLQQDLGDGTGAGVTQRLEMFVSLMYWVRGGQYFSKIPVVLDLPKAIRQVGALGTTATDSGSERPDIEMTRGLVGIAARLSTWLQDFEWSLAYPGELNGSRSEW